MDFLPILSIFNYGLALIYGLFLSIQIAGSWETPRQKKLVLGICPLFLLMQSICCLIFGVSTTKELYPFIIHLPLALILIFVLKKRPGVAFVSVFTAYLCCQLPRWVNLAVTALTSSPLLGEISYTLVILPIYFFLHRYFVRIAYDAMTYSPSNLFLFGSLPIVYYVFDYSMVIYSNALYAGIPALIEFFPTALIIFYVGFLSAYHAQTQKQLQAELQNSMLEMELKQFGTELESLRRVDAQTAIYRHDMRHHLLVLESFLSAGKTEQAAEYIRESQTHLDSITPHHFCEHETVNLLCSAFNTKAEQAGITLKATVRLSKNIPIPDTELCALLSNGLENALRAAGQVPDDKWVQFHCEEREHELLIEIKNPYIHEVVMKNDIPVSTQPGHGYGCRSIRTIAEQQNGLYRFHAKDGIFTLRVMLPIPQTSTQE